MSKTEVTARCHYCAVEGLPGDHQGEGRIVADKHGHLACDDCGDAVLGQGEYTHLSAEESTGGWYVVDDRGGVWWPAESAQRALAMHDEPAVAVLRMCVGGPVTNGEWRS